MIGQGLLSQPVGVIGIIRDHLAVMNTRGIDTYVS